MVAFTRADTIDKIIGLQGALPHFPLHICTAKSDELLGEDFLQAFGQAKCRNVLRENRGKANYIIRDPVVILDRLC
ncbi:hypothetical protein D3C86_2142580 [compost metagenome]